eukprot:scaffold48_cov311-Pinguiococcus_pyrenoidosus.AAC.135
MPPPPMPPPAAIMSPMIARSIPITSLALRGNKSFATETQMSRFRVRSPQDRRLSAEQDAQLSPVPRASIARKALCGVQTEKLPQNNPTPRGSADQPRVDQLSRESSCATPAAIPGSSLIKFPNKRWTLLLIIFLPPARHGYQLSRWASEGLSATRSKRGAERLGVDMYSKYGDARFDFGSDAWREERMRLRKEATLRRYVLSLSSALYSADNPIWGACRDIWERSPSPPKRKMRKKRPEPEPKPPAESESSGSSSGSDSEAESRDKALAKTDSAERKSAEKLQEVATANEPSSSKLSAEEAAEAAEFAQQVRSPCCGDDAPRICWRFWRLTGAMCALVIRCELSDLEWLETRTRTTRLGLCLSWIRTSAPVRARALTLTTVERFCQERCVACFSRRWLMVMVAPSLGFCTVADLRISAGRSAGAICAEEHAHSATRRSRVAVGGDPEAGGHGIRDEWLEAQADECDPYSEGEPDLLGGGEARARAHHLRGEAASGEQADQRLPRSAEGTAEEAEAERRSFLPLLLNRPRRSSARRSSRAGTGRTCTCGDVVLRGNQARIPVECRETVGRAPALLEQRARSRGVCLLVRRLAPEPRARASCFAFAGRSLVLLNGFGTELRRHQRGDLQEALLAPHVRRNEVGPVVSKQLRQDHNPLGLVHAHVGGQVALCGPSQIVLNAVRLPEYPERGAASGQAAEPKGNQGKGLHEAELRSRIVLLESGQQEGRHHQTAERSLRLGPQDAVLNLDHGQVIPSNTVLGLRHPLVALPERRSGAAELDGCMEGHEVVQVQEEDHLLHVRKLLQIHGLQLAGLVGQHLEARAAPQRFEELGSDGHALASGNSFCVGALELPELFHSLEQVGRDLHGGACLGLVRSPDGSAVEQPERRGAVRNCVWLRSDAFVIPTQSLEVLHNRPVLQHRRGLGAFLLHRAIRVFAATLLAFDVDQHPRRFLLQPVGFDIADNPLGLGPYQPANA